MSQAELTFASRFEGVTGSAIRDIFKLLGVPGMISFAGGNPAWSALPDGLVAEMAEDVVRADGKALLQYGATEGYTAYRRETARFLGEACGMDVDAAHILPTTGSTQAVDLILKALINEGDAVLVEDPSFLGSLQAMKLYGARLVPVAMDENGLRPSAVEEAARQYRPKLLYTVPNFQNPTGVTLAADRREQIVRLAERYNFLIAEDDPYRGLRYSGEALPTLFSYDREARVVYLTSFSKLIAPGLRVGAAVTRHGALLRKLTIGKQSADLHSASLAQAIVAAFMERNLLTPHVAGILGAYRRQLMTMLEALQAFPRGVSYTRPDGGLFVWVTLPEGMDASGMLEIAVARKVAYVPGTHFYAVGGHANTLRLNFSNSEVEAIGRGMETLKQIILEG